MVADINSGGKSPSRNKLVFHMSTTLNSAGLRHEVGDADLIYMMIRSFSWRQRRTAPLNISLVSELPELTPAPLHMGKNTVAAAKHKLRWYWILKLANHFAKCS